MAWCASELVVLTKVRSEDPATGAQLGAACTYLQGSDAVCDGHSTPVTVELSNCPVSRVESNGVGCDNGCGEILARSLEGDDAVSILDAACNFRVA